MDTVIVSKFIKTLSVAEGPPTGAERAQLHEGESDKPPSDLFKTGTELMYGGQGKTTNNVNLMPVTAQTTEETSKNEETSDPEFRVHPDTNSRVDNVTNITKGLDQPRLDETNEEVTGENKRQLRTQNKRRKQRLRAAQVLQSQWTSHTGQVAYESTPLPRPRGTYRNSMCPTGRALNHPASDIFREWATLGCPTRTGCN